MITVLDVRHEIQKRLDSVSCVDDERDTLLSLRNYIDEGREVEVEPEEEMYP